MKTGISISKRVTITPVADRKTLRLKARTGSLSAPKKQLQDFSVHIARQWSSILSETDRVLPPATIEDNRTPALDAWGGVVELFGDLNDAFYEAANRASLIYAEQEESLSVADIAASAADNSTSGFASADSVAGPFGDLNDAFYEEAGNSVEPAAKSALFASVHDDGTFPHAALLSGYSSVPGSSFGGRI
jgi:hypothetical protein